MANIFNKEKYNYFKNKNQNERQRQGLLLMKIYYRGITVKSN